jgi:hypothetical protein
LCPSFSLDTLGALTHSSSLLLAAKVGASQPVSDILWVELR